MTLHEEGEGSHPMYRQHPLGAPPDFKNDYIKLKTQIKIKKKTDNALTYNDVQTQQKRDG